MASIRKRASGRYEARYRDPNGRQRGKAFRTKAEAQSFLDQVAVDIASHGYRDPRLGRVELREYATWWLENRVDLRPRTAELYEGLLRLHILPDLGDCQFDQLTSAVVRSWMAELHRRGRPGPSTAAKAYRLLRTVLNDAIEDNLLVRNPCTIRGAGVERPAERPIATVDEVYALAGAIEPRYRMVVLLATYCGLRVGELLALRRGRVDLKGGVISVVEQRQELRRGERIYGPPKTEAGVRDVTIPPHLVPELKVHMATWADQGKDAFVFTGPNSDALRRATLQTAWDRARAEVGLGHLHMHDLRHTGNTMAAATGASTKELMARMGHASPRAALIYQHATADRDRTIAERLSEMTTEARGRQGTESPAQDGGCAS